MAYASFLIEEDTGEIIAIEHEPDASLEDIKKAAWFALYTAPADMSSDLDVFKFVRTSKVFDKNGHTIPNRKLRASCIPITQAQVVKRG